MSASLLMLFNWLEGGQVLAGECMGQVVICGFSFKEMCPGWWMVIQKSMKYLLITSTSGNNLEAKSGQLV